MIMKLLEARTFILKIYQKARFIINPIVKFILSFMAFNMINAEIGFDPRFVSKKIVFLLSVICAVTPGGVLVFFAMVLSLLHVFSASPVLSILLLLVYIVLYGMLMRFSPKEALAAVAIPVLAKYNLHYCIPLFLGCIANPLAILPVSCGVIIYGIMDIVKAGASRVVNIKDLDAVLGLYTDVANAVIANKQIIISIVVFALVIVTVFIIRKFSFDYSFAISVGAGVVVNIIGFLIGDLKYDVMVSVGTLIWKSILCGLLAMILELFKRILDYSAIERVQFEDEDYYYYVKAVPKVNVSIPRHSIKRASDEDEEDDTDDSFDDDYPDDEDSEEVSYEDFSESDFNEEESEYEDDQIVYDREEDLSEYGMQRIGDDGSAGDSDDDEGYEVEMTLDDDNEDK